MNITLDNQKTLSTGALILAVVLLLAALGLALWPLPSVETQVKDLKNKSFKAELAGKTAKANTVTEHDKAANLTWVGSGNEIGPAAYQNLNKIASGLNVKLVSFRAQRITNAGDVSQMPFTLNAEGRYGDILKFVQEIETTHSKLAVELFQMGATDESSDQVTATIGLEAYILNAQPVDSSTSTTTKTATGSSPKAAATKSAPVTTETTTTVKTTTAGKPNVSIKQKEVSNGAKN